MGNQIIKHVTFQDYIAQPSPPSLKVVNTLWLDTIQNVLFKWDGFEWVPVSSQSGTADKVEYTTSADASILTVKDALDKLLYVPLTINFTPSKSIGEKGESISNFTLNWDYNKSVVSQTFDGTALTPSQRHQVIPTAITSNRTFTLVANDGRNNVTKTFTLQFVSAKYHGVSSSGDLTGTQMMGLTKTMNETRAATITVTSGAGEYIYYCIPSRLGTPSFTVGGFSGGFQKAKTFSFTNSHGFAENYDVWKSTNTNLGTTTVVIT